MIRKLILFFSAALLSFTGSGCIYSFTGSSLPSHLKTVEIPLFSNQSLEPNVADEITTELNKQIISANLLKIVQRNGDASVSGVVTSYSNTPYNYSAAGTRQVDVQQYIVRITADVEFMDKKKDAVIYKGTVTGEGVYDVQKLTERDGKQKAESEIVQRIMQNSVQGW
jgi:hypothetical protein